MHRSVVRDHWHFDAVMRFICGDFLDLFMLTSSWHSFIHDYGPSFVVWVHSLWPIQVWPLNVIGNERKKRPEFLPKEKYEKITAIINLFYIRSWCVCCVCRWLPHAHFVLCVSFFAFCTFLRAIASIVMEFTVQDKPHTHLFNSLVAFRNVQLYWNKYTRRVLWIKCNYTR